MKKLLLITFLSIFLFSCDKDDDHSTNPVDQLPPETQTGENKVGALVNGEPLLPMGGGLSPNKNCYYQYVDGGYYFTVWFAQIEGGQSQTIAVSTKHATIEEGEVYELKNSILYPYNEPQGRGGNFNIYTTEPPSETYFTTTAENTGELKITKLDYENNIVSGTFWFDAVNDAGEIVEVREGRFDMHFTQ